MDRVLVSEAKGHRFDKFAGSKFEQRSEAKLTPKGWSTGTSVPPLRGVYGIILEGIKLV